MHTDIEKSWARQWNRENTGKAKQHPGCTVRESILI